MPRVLVPFAEDRTDGEKRSFLQFLRDLMAKFLRKVQYKTNWDPAGEFSKYLPPGEAPADALQDLVTSDNTLSVWEIDDKGTNLERVLAAIASRGDHLQKIDYLIVDSRHLLELGLAMEKKTGQTHDGYANESWHFDLTHLSASDLSRLANNMFAHGKTDRKREPSLIELLNKSIESGFVDAANLRPNLLARLGKNH
jgi:hypothetical protein